MSGGFLSALLLLELEPVWMKLAMAPIYYIDPSIETCYHLELIRLQLVFIGKFCDVIRSATCQIASAANFNHPPLFFHAIPFSSTNSMPKHIIS